MGVKSTFEMTRADAVERLVSLYLEALDDYLRSEIEKLSNRMIESELERLNDQRCGGEGFENYQITWSMEHPR